MRQTSWVVSVFVIYSALSGLTLVEQRDDPQQGVLLFGHLKVAHGLHERLKEELETLLRAGRGRAARKGDCCFPNFSRCSLVWVDGV